MPHAFDHTNVTRSELYQGFFGRMFQNIPPQLHSTKENRESMTSYSDHMIESEKEANNAAFDNTKIPAGYTYFGQFVAHDITFDPVSSLERANDPDRLNNFRSPKFDLDCIYGNGPANQPFIYNKRTKKILLGKVAGTKEPDLLRNPSGTAIIGDPRNDENLINSQVQLAFIKFHNKVIEALPKTFKGAARFQEAQRIVRWHYQWVVVHDYLKRHVQKGILENCYPNPLDIKLRYFKWRNEVYMPVEFSTAAYRLGHTQVRNAYALNDILEKEKGAIPVFGGRHNNLRGFRKLPKYHTIQWDKFLDFGKKKKPQFSRKIRAKLSHALGKMPPALFPNGKNLAFRNLARGVALELPSGQNVAKAMGITPIKIKSSKGNDPLWYYILEEANNEGGFHLGPVGSTIVTEVFLGLLKRDPKSFYSLDPCWTPKKETVLRIPHRGNFELKDIIKYAEMPITKSDIQKIF